MYMKVHPNNVEHAHVDFGKRMIDMWTLGCSSRIFSAKTHTLDRLGPLGRGSCSKDNHTIFEKCKCCKGVDRNATTMEFS